MLSRRQILCGELRKTKITVDRSPYRTLSSHSRIEYGIGCYRPQWADIVTNYRAPAIFLYFINANAEQLTSALDEIAERFQTGVFNPMEWLFPTAAQCRLTIAFQNEIPEHYSKETRRLLAEEVGFEPGTILRVTLYNSGVAARDSAATVTLDLLGRFSGVVEDGSDKHSIWTLGEVRDSIERSSFLTHFNEVRS